jgi:hypothetical protein
VSDRRKNKFTVNNVLVIHICLEFHFSDVKFHSSTAECVEVTWKTDDVTDLKFLVKCPVHLKVTTYNREFCCELKSAANYFVTVTATGENIRDSRPVTVKTQTKLATPSESQNHSPSSHKPFTQLHIFHSIHAENVTIDQIGEGCVRVTWKVFDDIHVKYRVNCDKGKVTHQDRGVAICCEFGERSERHRITVTAVKDGFRDSEPGSERILLTGTSE